MDLPFLPNALSMSLLLEMAGEIIITVSLMAQQIFLHIMPCF